MILIEDYDIMERKLKKGVCLMSSVTPYGERPGFQACGNSQEDRQKEAALISMILDVESIDSPALEIETEVNKFSRLHSKIELIPKCTEMFRKVMDENREFFEKLSSHEKRSEIFNIYFDDLYSHFKKTSQYKESLEKIRRRCSEVVQGFTPNPEPLEIAAKPVCKSAVNRLGSYFIDQVTTSLGIQPTMNDNIHTIKKEYRATYTLQQLGGRSLLELNEDITQQFAKISLKDESCGYKEVS